MARANRVVCLECLLRNAYRLELIPVPLGQRNSRFAEVMKHLLPQATLAAPADAVSHGWQILPVIVRLFEMNSQTQQDRRWSRSGTSQSGLLGSFGARRRSTGSVRAAWMKRGITDPTAMHGRDALPRAPLHMLASYLDGLENKLDRLCSGHGSRDEQALLGNLRKQLQSYAADCRAALSALGGGDELPELEGGDLWAEGLPELYKLLATPVKAKAPAPGSSQCIIRLRDNTGERPPFIGLVLLDPALASHQRPARSIRFSGTRTLQEALNSTPAELMSLNDEIAGRVPVGQAR